MEWDTWAYQDRLLRQIDERRRYRGEHITRIARKQSNGSPFMRDQLSGEIAAMEALLGGGRFHTRDDLIKEIEHLVEKTPRCPSDTQHKDVFIGGWKHELEGRLP